MHFTKKTIKITPSKKILTLKCNKKKESSLPAAVLGIEPGPPGWKSEILATRPQGMEENNFNAEGMAWEK